MHERSTIKAVLLSVYVLFGQVSVLHGQGTDFREVTWGMSRLEVMAHEESGPVSLDAPFIYYTSRVAGQEHHLLYGFIEDKLVNAVYIIVTQSPREYRYFKKNIESKYGRPKKSYDGGSQNYLFFWENERTEITIRPGNIRECRIEYMAKKFKPLRANKEKERKQRLSDELSRAY
ncbi:MAG: hypothetical protein KKD44_14390 [Proteobacteria bacterium]|nr:hypothetical protein [Pseudomonadota bacterium]